MSFIGSKFPYFFHKIFTNLLYYITVIGYYNYNKILNYWRS